MINQVKHLTQCSNCLKTCPNKWFTNLLSCTFFVLSSLNKNNYCILDDFQYSGMLSSLDLFTNYLNIPKI